MHELIHIIHIKKGGYRGLHSIFPEQMFWERILKDHVLGSDRKNAVKTADKGKQDVQLTNFTLSYKILHRC